MRTRNWAAAILTAVMIFVGTLQYARSQDHECKVVGWEVFSTNTPGGAGQPKSEGLTGERTPWPISTPAPSTGGTGVVNIIVRYYCCKECRDAALKKMREDRDKRKDSPKKKDSPKGGKPPAGPNVPSFDPRFYELDKDGKVVPKKPKSDDPKRSNGG